MPPRAILQRVIQETDGDVRAGVAVTVTETSGAPLAVPMYAASTGGATLTSPLTTDNLGRAVAYTALPREVLVSVPGGTPEPAWFRPDGTSLGLLDATVTTLKGATWNPMHYGAVNDGASHPLSSVYATLAAAQAVYGATVATDLAQEIDRCAIQYCAAQANAAGGGTVFMPAGGGYMIDCSVDERTYSDVVLQGAGMEATRWIVTATMDGRDAYGGGLLGAAYAGTRGNNQYFANSVIHAINNVQLPDPPGPNNAPTGTSGVAQDPATHVLDVPVASYARNLSCRDFSIDCTLQTQANGPLLAGGWNAAAIEYQDVHNASVYRVKIVGAAGNGIVMSSIDPGKHAALRGGIIEDCILEDCCDTALISYGNYTGSVIQYGAMDGGRIAGNQIIRPGNPAIDFFNCRWTDVGPNLISGVLASPIALAANVGSIHSDFGNEECSVHDNTHVETGGIVLLGNGNPQFENDFLGTAGPKRCTIARNKISGTAKVAHATPGIYATTSNDPSRRNQTGYDLGVELTLGVGAALTGVELRSTTDGTTSATVWTDTGFMPDASAAAKTFRFVIPRGIDTDANGIVDTWYYPVLTYSGAVSWAWYRLVNGTGPAVSISGGSFGATASVADRNKLTENVVTGVPGVGVQLYDAPRNDMLHNDVRDCGSWDRRVAYGFYQDSTGIGGAASRSTGNVYAGNRVGYSEASTERRLLASWAEGSTNNGAHTTFAPGNLFDTGRAPGGGGGALSVVSNQPGMHKLASPTVQATGVVTTNQISGGTNPTGFASECLVRVAPGTASISVIAVDGVATGLTAGWFRVTYGTTIALTYTGGSAGNPSWDWFSVA